MHIDLNCDMGESFGAWKLGADEAITPYITSANIACGFHAGDSRVMERTVRLALEHGVAIGAHPGFPDLVGFGRRTLDATPDEIESDVLYQIGALDAFVRSSGKHLTHVKAHGALYNLAAAKPEIANAIARAIKRFDSDLVMVGLAGSAMIDAAQAMGLRFAREGFCDRAYQADGKLVSRREKGSLLSDPQLAAKQALQIVLEQSVTTMSGEKISFVADTLCIHGDTPTASAIARAVREALQENGVTVAALA
ncbi:MAG: 5-oxoprolinase subunit PxpA [Chloroflexi bacterium]|nr:5-oxoprolinase subunit PxpA [Chloroflexota bacterium]